MTLQDDVKINRELCWVYDILTYHGLVKRFDHPLSNVAYRECINAFIGLTSSNPTLSNIVASAMSGYDDATSTNVTTTIKLEIIDFFDHGVVRFYKNDVYIKEWKISLVYVPGLKTIIKTIDI